MSIAETFFLNEQSATEVDKGSEKYFEDHMDDKAAIESGIEDGILF